MEHSIRVDDDVFGALKQRAEAFVDTPNSVLRSVLGLDSDSNGSGVRADRPKPPGDSPTRQALAQPAYEVPLLKAIADLGGKARRWRRCTKAV